MKSQIKTMYFYFEYTMFWTMGVPDKINGWIKGLEVPITIESTTSITAERGCMVIVWYKENV